jgi:hypothetical protein
MIHVDWTRRQVWGQKLHVSGDIFVERLVYFGSHYVNVFVSNFSACDCDMRGSESMQCDKRTGQCTCVTGVTGYKCDRCARGTTGELPNCVPCGECFDNWDRIVRDLRGLLKQDFFFGFRSATLLPFELSQ